MADSEDPGKETRLVLVKDRNIVVRQLNDAQLLLLGREARLASVGRIFDLLESAVVQEEDREYLMDLAVKGDLELNDMLGFIRVFAESEQKPRVRRGRYAKKS